ncbi:hypothetical protein [Stenotrophomonas sp.]|uniref:hypothetical protein n=1 Tax=Stenotrophomonas sp. TaxID=69392 RepID=UPI0028B0896E|nr:hypothetical protein [Stenotrophomonas sp.]
MRIILVVALFIVSAILTPAVLAQQSPCSVNNGWCSDEGTAYSAAIGQAKGSYSDTWKNSYLTISRSCPDGSGANYCRISVSTGHSPGDASGPGPYTRYWMLANSCAKRPSQTTPFLPVTGSTRCNLGCVVKYAQNADETSIASTTGSTCADDDFKKDCPSGSYWNGYMGVCEPIDKPCPEGQKKKNGQCVPDGQCPDGMISTPGTTPGAIQQGSLYCSPEKSECPAGNVKSPSGQCLPGDGQCSAGEAKGKDGTCKKDSNGDGKPDEEDGEQDPNKDSASGGDSCDSPPSCSGNAIQCMQVKVQWRIDCNTRKNRNVSGGTCTAVPICTGDKCDAMEYASLMQQWKSACALEKLAKGGSDEGSGDSSDANGNGVPDVLEGTGEVTGPGDGNGDVQGAKRFGIGVSTSLLDQDNIFGGGSCPQPPTFQLMGVTISGADFPYWCKAMSILRALILVFGAFTALKILMGWGL